VKEEVEGQESLGFEKSNKQIATATKSRKRRGGSKENLPGPGGNKQCSTRRNPTLQVHWKNARATFQNADEV